MVWVQIKAVDPNILGQSSDPCSLLSLNVMQTVTQCMTKYDVVVQLWFDKTIVNTANYNSNYKSTTEKNLLTYTAALSVTTIPVVGRRDISYFKVQATLVVRGENVAQALTEKLKNTTAVIAGLGLNGLATLSRPYYCLDGGTCSSGAVSTTPAPARDTGSGTGSNSGGSGNGGGAPGTSSAAPAQTNTSNASWTDMYLATLASFETLSSMETTAVATAAAAREANQTTSGDGSAVHTSAASNETSPSRRLLSVQKLPRSVLAAEALELPKRRRPQ